MARQRGSTWQVDITVDGKRTRKDGFNTEAEANAYEKSLKDKLPVATSAITFGPFIEAHFEWLWGETKAPEASRINCRMLQKYIEPDTLLTAITAAKIQEMVLAMQQERMANATINRKLSTLSKLLRHSCDLDIIPKVPTMPYRKEANSRERTLSRKEEDQMIDFFLHLELKRSAALVDFLLYTGCRRGEAYKLKRDDTQLKDGEIEIVFRDTKNGTTRAVPMAPKALEAWEFFKKESDLECPIKVLSYNTFQGHWRLAKEHLGASDDPGFVPHMLRHTCCTRLVRGDMPTIKVMNWLGHKSPTMMLRYTHLVGNDLKKGVNLLSQGD